MSMPLLDNRASGINKRYVYPKSASFLPEEVERVREIVGLGANWRCVKNNDMSGNERGLADALKVKVSLEAHRVIDAKTDLTRTNYGFSFRSS
jgi:hypothetical protein